jgi:DNA-binding transcriptional regulator YdaS (Cro superfamily)
MKTKDAIELAKSSKGLADLLGITQGAVSQWGEQIPTTRVWQLRVIKPEWFKQPRKPAVQRPAAEKV